VMKPSPRLSEQDFVAWMRREGEAHYHHRHPFHLRMHEGRLSADELRRWALNRYYYQTRIPIKDALILSKTEDPAFRRMWIRRIVDHDGTEEGTGGLFLWQKLAEAVGVDSDELTSLRSVHPGVRSACDDYVDLVRSGSLLEAVASSLTELFAPRLMAARLQAWEHHYPWVNTAALEYFRVRVDRSQQDAKGALAYVLKHAATHEQQTRCVAALGRKLRILWAMLDCIDEPPLQDRAAIA
jgi:pyrroloquinoline-quinone synthase